MNGNSDLLTDQEKREELLDMAEVLRMSVRWDGSNRAEYWERVIDLIEGMADIVMKPEED